MTSSGLPLTSTGLHVLQMLRTRHGLANNPMSHWLSSDLQAATLLHEVGIAGNRRSGTTAVSAFPGTFPPVTMEASLAELPNRRKDAETERLG